jgi:hypothetical protein
MKKIYVDNSNQVKILCPKCGLEQTKNVFKFKDSDGRCGRSYDLSVMTKKLSGG